MFLEKIKKVLNWLSRNRKKIVSKLVLVLFSFLLTFMLVESMTRVYGIPSRAKADKQDKLTLYDFDETLGWVTRKQVKQYRFIPPFHGHFVYTNPDGFPADKSNWDTVLDKEKPSIALIGDSFVAGEYLVYNKTFPHILGQNFPDKQIINLGVPGYDPGHYLLTARKHIPQFNVEKIIVFFFPANDISDLKLDNVLGYSKPFFGDPDKMEPTNTPLEKRDRIPRNRNFIQKIVDNSSLYTLLRPFVKRFDPVYNRYLASPEAAIYKEGEMDQALKFVKQIQKEFTDKDFYVYYLPRMEEFMFGTFEDNVSIFKKLSAKYAFNFLIPEFDSLENFREAYLKKDGHLSEKGSQMVAEQIYNTLSIRR